VIRFTGLGKSFGGSPVLADVSFTIPEGETTVLLGHSGSGKSVVLKHIVGLLEPDQGSVEVDGRVVHELDYDELMGLRRQIGYVFQSGALFDSMTVGENIALGLRGRGLSEAEIESRVGESLRLVELPGTEQLAPSELSGGMRKRVGVARAIALKPRYILYDEPTTGLDPVTTAAMDALIVRAREDSGATSVVVTHDLRSAFAVADRIAFLYQGRIRQAGTRDEIRSSSDPVIREFLGETT
jgi:phospholipid/cholesterol/gamma-HCH transport system ATP-binding protein